MISSPFEIHCPVYPEALGQSWRDGFETYQDKLLDVIWTPSIRLAFVLHLVFRTFLELLFIGFAYWLQLKQNGEPLGFSEVYNDSIIENWHVWPNIANSFQFTSVWHVPERYICKHGDSIDSPCFQDKERNPKKLGPEISKNMGTTWNKERPILVHGPIDHWAVRYDSSKLENEFF